jgi:hypothetical protein
LPLRERLKLHDLAIPKRDIVAPSLLAGFTPTQQKAQRAIQDHRFVLFGGSRGPGKSYWLRWSLLCDLIEYWRRGLSGVRVMLACEDYPTLYERHITKMEVEFPPWLGELHIGRKEFRLHPQYGGGVIALRNLDDPSRYQSAEFAQIAIDELTKDPLSTFNILRGSLRWPGIEGTGFIAATNPNGRFMNWVRRYWIERDFPPELESEADEFVFVPGLPTDNPHLPASYLRELDTLPTSLRQAWRDGDWYAAVEGLVYGEFGAENITDAEPDPERPIELAFDDGYIDPRAILFVQRFHDRILVFDEIYHGKHLAEESVTMVVERCEQNGWSLPELAVGSHEANELKEHFRRANIPARSLNHKVVEGVQVVRSLIRDGNGYRVLRINSRCGNLIDEITSGYRYPENGRGSNEKPMDGNDHACFVAGTMIATERGDVPIEDVTEHDRVLTRFGYFPTTGSKRTCVVATVLSVEFNTGIILTATPEHPVWVDAIGWRRLDSLGIGTPVWALTNSYKLPCVFNWVSGLKHKGGNHTVYNLYVDGPHEYFADGILVHNCDALRYWCYVRARRFVPELGE